MLCLELKSQRLLSLFRRWGQVEGSEATRANPVIGKFRSHTSSLPLVPTAYFSAAISKQLGPSHVPTMMFCFTAAPKQQGTKLWPRDPQAKGRFLEVGHLVTAQDCNGKITGIIWQIARKPNTYNPFHTCVTRNQVLHSQRLKRAPLKVLKGIAWLQRDAVCILRHLCCEI